LLIFRENQGKYIYLEKLTEANLIFMAPITAARHGSGGTTAQKAAPLLRTDGKETEAKLFVSKLLEKAAHDTRSMMVRHPIQPGLLAITTQKSSGRESIHLIGFNEMTVTRKKRGSNIRIVGGHKMVEYLLGINAGSVSHVEDVSNDGDIRAEIRKLALDMRQNLGDYIITSMTPDFV
jgi:hypothetical protein